MMNEPARFPIADNKTCGAISVVNCANRRRARLKRRGFTNKSGGEKKTNRFADCLELYGFSHLTKSKLLSVRSAYFCLSFPAASFQYPLVLSIFTLRLLYEL